MPSALKYFTRGRGKGANHAAFFGRRALRGWRLTTFLVVSASFSCDALQIASRSPPSFCASSSRRLRVSSMIGSFHMSALHKFLWCADGCFFHSILTGKICRLCFRKYSPVIVIRQAALFFCFAHLPSGIDYFWVRDAPVSICSMAKVVFIYPAKVFVES